MSNTYNGWTNRETWLVNIWYNPETVGDVQYAKEDLEEKVASLDGIIQDLIDIDCINWDELEESMDDEEEEPEEDEDWEDCKFVVLLGGEDLVDGEAFTHIDFARARVEQWWARGTKASIFKLN